VFILTPSKDSKKGLYFVRSAKAGAAVTYDTIFEGSPVKRSPSEVKEGPDGSVVP
jgi:hypothetical protein